MLGALMVGRVRSNLNGGLIVTIDHCMRSGNMKVSQKVLNQTISVDTEANAWYSASAEDLLKVFWLLAFHETKELPKKMQNPVVERRVSIQEPQSAST